MIDLRMIFHNVAFGFSLSRLATDFVPEDHDARVAHYNGQRLQLYSTGRKT